MKYALKWIGMERFLNVGMNWWAYDLDTASHFASLADVLSYAASRDAQVRDWTRITIVGVKVTSVPRYEEVAL